MKGLRETRLAQNWAWSLVREGLVLTSAVISVLLLIPRLGPAHYGAWVALFALLGPAQALAHGGVRLTILESILRDRQTATSVARSSLTLSLVVSAFIAPVATIGGLLWIGTLSPGVLILFVASELVANAILNTLVSVVQGAYSYPRGIQLRLAIGSARIGVLLVLVSLDSVSIENLVLGNAAMLFAATPLVYLVAARLGLGLVLLGKVQPGHVRTTLSHGVGIGSSIAQNDGDKVVLNAFAHQADAGLYAAGYRLASLLMTPLRAFLASSHLAMLEGARTSSNQLHRATVYAAITMAYAVPAVGAAVVLAPLVPRILGSEFEESSLILQLVAPIAVIRFVGSLASNGLLGLGQNALRMWLLVGGAALSMILYLLLIPEYSWRGALVGSLASELSLAAGCWLALYCCQQRSG